MDALLTAGTETVDGSDEAELILRNPDAPYGRKPDGTPYKRDPAQMAAIRAARGTGRRGSRGPAPARGAQPSRPATAGRKSPSRATKPAYGAAIARAVVQGSALFLKDPVEQAIMRHQGVQLAVIVDRMLDEDPRMLRLVEKLRLKMAGGAKGDFALWLAGTGGLVAMNRGFKHPMLFAMFGATLDQVRVQAVEHEQAQAQAREKMSELMAQYAAEEAELLTQAADAVDGARPSPLAQFAGV